MTRIWSTSTLLLIPGNHNRDQSKPYPAGSTANAGHTNQVFEAGPG